LAETLTIHEVGPRDGLQNESTLVSTEDKADLIARLVEAGCSNVEVSSFVRPRWVPQLADAEDLIPRLPQGTDCTFWALVPNRRGMDRALESGIGAVATFMSSSETHNEKNVNRTLRESLAALREVIATAKAEGLLVRAYLSTVFGCPYEGDVDPAKVADLAGELVAAGADHISLGDTTGMGDPSSVERVLGTLVEAGVPLDSLAMHMHDTRGTALANVLTGLRFGVRRFDASVAGLGGCPYAPGASGNLATEDIVHMLHAMGHDTGIDLDTLSDTGAFMARTLGKELPGRYHRYHLAQRARAERERSVG
jgi:hydroxymethylglutaryl-CoA lyase